MTAGLQTIVQIYCAMITARLIDYREMALVNQGLAFFHVSGAGHEGTAALVPHLTGADWLHCHYRDKALLIMRGIPPVAFFGGLLCRAKSQSSGRQMSAHLCDPALKVLSIVGPVGNNALQSVGIAASIRDQPERPIVLCAMGDGTSQQGEFFEACAEAVRNHLPVLFLIEDNEWAISTQTSKKTFFSRPDGLADDFYGMDIHRINGVDITSAYEEFGKIVAKMREGRGPALVHFIVKRLSDHTNGDDQTLYRTTQEVEKANLENDPIRSLEVYLASRGISGQQIREIKDKISLAVQAAETEALHDGDPETIYTAKMPLALELKDIKREYRGSFPRNSLTPRMTMLDAIRTTLYWHLQSDRRVFLYGQDIEDPKGDVFGITRGLSSAFPGRVRNSPLSESTIVGSSIGRALAGERPVAFLQFADFLPLALNQIISELGSMYWRTSGQLQAPVIILVSCGGYRPGLGPFHAQSLESMIAHTPGIDVFMPSNAADAAGLLNAAFASGRPTVFFYPKAALNFAHAATSPDVERHFVPIGISRKIRHGDQLTFVCWGNTVSICEKAAEALEEIFIQTEIIDLRTLSPLDIESILSSVTKTGKLVVVHEDNMTCGIGAEIMASVGERVTVPVKMKRVARSDTYIPCNYANQLEILPSFKSTLAAAAELLELSLNWENSQLPVEEHFVVGAIGSGATDEAVRILKLYAGVGNPIRAGEAIAEIEASKSTFVMESPASGEIIEVFAVEGKAIEVGQPILTIQIANQSKIRKPITQERPGRPVLNKILKAATNSVLGTKRFQAESAWIRGVAAVKGSRVVSNEELLSFHPGRTSVDVIQRTGIECRRWAAENETLLSLAADACHLALNEAGIKIGDIDLIICSTVSPEVISPSLACQILWKLADGNASKNIPAYDINAACSGYLYGLQAAYDFLQSKPASRVLLVTSEIMSKRLNPLDFSTAFLFGDAASATIVVGERHLEGAIFRLHRPELSAKGEPGEALSVPLTTQNGFIEMDGDRVFAEAVRSMILSLNKACNYIGINVNELACVIPHQANQRILDAIKRKIGAEIISNIRLVGNTSSSSIPLAIVEKNFEKMGKKYIGLCAFGGGFTFGGCILETNEGSTHNGRDRN